MKIKILQAFNGDSILISFKDKSGKNRNILVDGGTTTTYEYHEQRIRNPLPGQLKLAIEEIKQIGEKIDLLIITHVDSDHIGGIVRWIEEEETEAADFIGKIWFNSGKLISAYLGPPLNKGQLIPISKIEGTDTSIKQGIYVENFIEENDIWHQKIIKDEKKISRYGVKFKIISPSDKKLKILLKKWEEKQPDTDTQTTVGENDYKLTLKELIEKDRFKEDKSAHNGSSIAFILTYNSKNVLFLGDAHPSVIINGLRYFGYSATKPLKTEMVKVSHHGSKANTNYELLSLIDCNKFIISTDGEAHNLPNKQCLARIINSKPGVNLYFNYPDIIDEIFTEQDHIDFRFFTFSCAQEFII